MALFKHFVTVKDKYQSLISNPSSVPKPKKGMVETIKNKLIKPKK